jgi:hypothetical protein
MTPRWWQALAITRQLEHDADGKLVWREVVESAPRRAGKSVRLRISAVWRCMRGKELFGEPQLAMLTSKDLGVGKEIHRGSWRWAERHDWDVYRVNGGQEIVSPLEDRWLLRAPNAVYGYDVCYGQVDESWGVDPMAITDGLEPALLERMSPQLHLTSTAHVKASSLMRRRLTAALRSADPDVLLLLWGAGPGADVADEGTWRAASPHWSDDRRDLIARKYAAALAGKDEPEFDDPDPVRGWAAQYLNIWPLLLADDVGIFGSSWATRATSLVRPEPWAIGIGVSLKHEWGSIAACGLRDGRPHVDAVKREPGDGWLVAEAKRIQDSTGAVVAVNGKGPASDLIDDLQDEGVRLEIANMDDYIGACESFYRRVVTDGTLTHSQTTELDEAARVAGWREIGERRAFGHKNSAGDISMLEAATLAAWAAVTACYDPLDSVA